MVSLADIFLPPQWSQVGVMKGNLLVLLLGQVERRERDDVVDMPAKHSIIAPIHLGCELLLDDFLQLLVGASQIFPGGKIFP